MKESQYMERKTYNHHQQSTGVPRVQRKSKETLDSDSNWEQQGRDQQCMQLTINKQSIRYLHTLAGFAVESEWIKAIKVGRSQQE